MVCKNCGNLIEDGAMFCGECGAKVEIAAQEDTTSQPTVPVSFDAFKNSNTTVGSSDDNSSGGASSDNSSPVGNVAKNISAKLPANLNKKAIAICVAVVVVFVVALVAISLSKGQEKAPEPNEPDFAVGMSEESTSEVEMLYMPTCRMWSYNDIENYFGSKNYNISYEYAYDSTVPADCVISQSIAAGTEVAPDTNIVFVISKGEDVCPEVYKQKLVVTGSANSSYARVELFIWEHGAWKSQYSCNATVGRNGIGYDYGEGKGITPAGDFALGVLLSQYQTSNATWPHKLVTTSTCVVDDTSSSLYNTIVDSYSLPDNVSFDPIGDTIINGNSDKCMYIEHNGNGLDSNNVVPGRGSVITLCSKTNGLHPTAGCIDVSADDFNAMLNLLDYNLTPHIIIVVE